MQHQTGSKRIIILQVYMTLLSIRRIFSTYQSHQTVVGYIIMASTLEFTYNLSNLRPPCRKASKITITPIVSNLCNVLVARNQLWVHQQRYLALRLLPPLARGLVPTMLLHTSKDHQAFVMISVRLQYVWDCYGLHIIKT